MLYKYIIWLAAFERQQRKTGCEGRGYVSQNYCLPAAHSMHRARSGQGRAGQGRVRVKNRALSCLAGRAQLSATQHAETGSP